jgi:hypothetical protein
MNEEGRRMGKRIEEKSINRRREEEQNRRI